MTVSSPKAADNERWRFDLSSHILFAPDAAQGPTDGRLFWLTSYQHEIAHWVRWQSSSIGLAVTLLRRARAITALNTLNRLNRRGREYVVDLVKQRPLWSYSAGYDPMLVAKFDDQFALAGQMWLDMRFLEESLIESSDGMSAVWPADAAVGPALSDAWRAAESFLPTMPHPENDIADHFFVEAPGAAKHNGLHPDPRLTTRAIWESACTLDELDADDLRGDYEDDHADRRRLIDSKLQSDAYGFALRVAYDFAGTLCPRLFGLIAWLATDPPLPFFPPFGGEIRWSKFHPPYRFLRLYAAVRDRQAFRTMPDSVDVCEFADDLLRAANLERANWPTTQVRRSVLTIEANQPVPLYDWAADYDSCPAASQKTVGSLNMLVKASMALRATFREAPSKFVYPHIAAFYMPGEDSKHWELDSHKANGLLIPLAMDFRDGVHSHISADKVPMVSNKHGTEYVASLLLRESLDSFIEGRPMRRSQLPREFRDWRLGQPRPTEQHLLAGYDVAIDW